MGIGNYGRVLAQAALNLPISPEMAVRLSVDSENHGAYFRNVSETGGLGRNDLKAGRAQLLYKGPSGLTINFKGTVERRRGTAYPIQTTDQPDFTVSLSIGGKQSPSNFDIYEDVSKIVYEFNEHASVSLTGLQTRSQAERKSGGERHA